MKNISTHITYDEATHTDTGLKNDPNELQLKNMQELAFNVFEPLRLHFGVPIKINSFFRSEIVNNKVCGAKTSQHLANKGAAIDISIKHPTITNEDLFNWIKDNLTWDQLINEYNFQWVHVSFNKGKNRKDILKIV